MKTKLRGLLAVGKELNYEALEIEFEVPKVTLKKWARDITSEQLTQDILELKDDETELIINSETGVIEVLETPKAKALRGKAASSPAKFRDKVDGLRLLNEEVQASAGTLVTEITRCVEDSDELSPRDLASLASALTSVQNAFFNKPTTNIQVNTISEGGTSLLASFRENLKS